MDLRPQLSRIWDWLLHFGAYPEETLEQRAKRRLFLAVMWIATLAIWIISAAPDAMMWHPKISRVAVQTIRDHFPGLPVEIAGGAGEIAALVHAVGGGATAAHPAQPLVTEASQIRGQVVPDPIAGSQPFAAHGSLVKRPRKPARLVPNPHPPPVTGRPIHPLQCPVCG